MCLTLKLEEMIIKARMGNDHRVEEAIVQIKENEHEDKE